MVPIRFHRCAWVWIACQVMACAAPVDTVDHDRSGRLDSLAPAEWLDPEIDRPYRSWTRDEFREFAHRSTGGRLLPQDWWEALELPHSRALWTESREYLESHVGMVFDPSGGSPLGVTTTYINETYLTPFEATGNAMGVNCAFCHIGQIHYEGTRMLIPGGSGRIDTERFNALLIRSLQATVVDWSSEGKFWTFWSKVNTYNWTPLQLSIAIKTYIYSLNELQATSNVVEGFGRSDTASKALAAFSYYDSRNQTTLDAPVSVPSLWDTHRYDYRHYSGSIRQALARDIQATIGGGVGIALEPGRNQYRSSVDVHAIYEIEQMLEELAPPEWPEDIFGPLDRERVSEGHSLFVAHCASCHAGTSAPDGGIELTMTSLEDLGTDPVAARKLNQSVLYLDRLGLGVRPASDAFQIISDGIMNRAFYEMGASPAERREYTEGRANEFRAPLAYRATPLLGVWATPPYLHNGSAPTLHDLLLPADQRPARFRVCVDTEYDPQRVGLRADDHRAQCRTLDTSLSGNRNTGHEYGIELTEDERLALLEYLKAI